MLKRILITGLVAFLNACGGGSDGDNQQVTEVKAQTLSYGLNAVVNVAGLDLRASMTATTGVCKDPTFSTQSVPQLATLNCVVTAIGEQPITITGSNGQVLYKGTLTVPLPQVALLTDKGNIVLELNPVAAPVTVNNFLKYVNSGYYASTMFHRVIAGFVVQGGGYTTGLVRKTGQTAPIALESNKGLTNTRGTIAMARTSDPNSANSEFFFNLVDNTFLDYQNANDPGYAVFGKVVQGLDVVDAIGAIATGVLNGVSDVPTTDVTIKLALQSQ